MRPDELPDQIRDAFYITVGLTVLALRAIDEQRRGLVARLESPLDDAGLGLGTVTERVERLGARIDERTKRIEERIEALESRIDEVLDRVETTLPDGAREVMAQARGAAKDARGQLRNLVARAA